LLKSCVGLNSFTLLINWFDRAQVQIDWRIRQTISIKSLTGILRDPTFQCFVRMRSNQCFRKYFKEMIILVNETRLLIIETFIYMKRESMCFFCNNKEKFMHNLVTTAAWNPTCFGVRLFGLLFLPNFIVDGFHWLIWEISADLLGFLLMYHVLFVTTIKRKDILIHLTFDFR
jgi:hypothetical protein